MFHKQNIPASAPSRDDLKDQPEDQTVETAEVTEEPTAETAMPSNTSFPRPGSQMGGQPSAFGMRGVASSQKQEEGRKLTIGQGITLSGEIENCDQLLVEGTVEASLNGAKLLDIAESGIFYGSVDIEEAVIAGRFEGDLTVDGRVTVESTGTVIGTITYRELTVEAGANIEGKISSFASNGGKPASSQTAADFSQLKAASKTKKQVNAA